MRSGRCSWYQACATNAAVDRRASPASHRSALSTPASLSGCLRGRPAEPQAELAALRVQEIEPHRQQVSQPRTGVGEGEDFVRVRLEEGAQEARPGPEAVLR